MERQSERRLQVLSHHLNPTHSPSSSPFLMVEHNKSKLSDCSAKLQDTKVACNNSHLFDVLGCYASQNNTCKKDLNEQNFQSQQVRDIFSLMTFVFGNILLGGLTGKQIESNHSDLLVHGNEILTINKTASVKPSTGNKKDANASEISGTKSNNTRNISEKGGNVGKKEKEMAKSKTSSTIDKTSHPSFIDKIIRSFQGSGPLSTDSIQAFNNILFLVNSIPPSLNSLSIFNIMLRSAPTNSDLLPFLAQVKIPKSALGGTDYKTFITTLSKVQVYLPSWYYGSLVLGKALNNFDAILLYSAQRFAREIKIKKAVSGALIYPAIMSVFGVVGITVLLTRILPQNIQIFESMGLTVPTFLQTANFLVRCVQYHWLALLYLIPASLSTQYLPFRAYLKMQYMKMHTPIGNLGFLQDKATLLHTLSLLDKEQICSKLLLVSTNLSGNAVLQHMVEGMAALAKYGASADEVLAYMLKQKHIFSPYEIAYLQACFLSGKHSIIQDGLRYVSNMVLKQYTTQLSTILKVLNPATILMVGVLVAVIAALGIFPLIELTSSVQAKT